MRSWTSEQEALIELGADGKPKLGRVAVSADAGAGKTSVLVERIKRLPASLVNGRRVLCVSFTEKSKADLEERLAELPHCEVHTIHGFCLRIVSEFGSLLQLSPVARILSQAECDDLFYRAFERVYRRKPPMNNEHGANAFWQLCRAALEAGPDAVVQDCSDFPKDDLCDFVKSVLSEFEAAKKTSRALEYSDLERFADQLLGRREVLEQLRNRYAHVFVDEFQDTSEIQCRIVRSLTGQSGLLFVVGDVKQSIYRFRGADVAVFQAFTQELPARSRLSSNFRSHPDVIEAVNSVCAPLISEYDSMVAKRSECEPWPVWSKLPRVARVTSETDAEAIAALVKKLQNEGVALADIVLLLRRVRGNAKLFEELGKLGIAVAGAASASSTDGGTVSKLTNLWIWACEPWLKLRSAQVVVDFADQVPRTRLDALIRELPKVDAGAVSCETLIDWLDTHFKLHQRFGALFEQFRSLILSYQARGLSACTVAVSFEQHQEREEPIDGLDVLPPPSNLSGSIRVMTIHGSKGLEFPVVILADLGKRRAPSRSYVRHKDRIWLPARNEKGDLDKSLDELKSAIEAEERAEQEESARILYVAMTRAMEALYVVDRPEQQEDSEKKPVSRAKKAPDPTWALWLKKGVATVLPVSKLETALGDGHTDLSQSSRSIAATDKHWDEHAPQYIRARLRITELAAKMAAHTEPTTITKPLGSAGVENAARIGTEVHAYLERGDWEGLKKLAATEKLALTRFWSWLKTEEGQKIFGGEARTYPEFAFEWRTELGTVTGRIDRLVVLRGDQGTEETWVIDYKVIRARKSSQDLLESYGPQLALYAEAVKKLTKKGHVRAFLVDVCAATGKVFHEVDCRKTYTL